MAVESCLFLAMALQCFFTPISSDNADELCRIVLTMNTRRCKKHLTLKFPDAWLINHYQSLELGIAFSNMQRVIVKILRLDKWRAGFDGMSLVLRKSIQPSQSKNSIVSIKWPRFVKWTFPDIHQPSRNFMTIFGRISFDFRILIRNTNKTFIFLARNSLQVTRLPNQKKLEYW